MVIIRIPRSSPSFLRLVEFEEPLLGVVTVHEITYADTVPDRRIAFYTDGTREHYPFHGWVISWGTGESCGTNGMIKFKNCGLIVMNSDE